METGKKSVVKSKTIMTKPDNKFSNKNRSASPKKRISVLNETEIKSFNIKNNANSESISPTRRALNKNLSIQQHSNKTITMSVGKNLNTSKFVSNTPKTSMSPKKTYKNSASVVPSSSGSKDLLNLISPNKKAKKQNKAADNSKEASPKKTLLLEESNNNIQNNINSNSNSNNNENNKSKDNETIKDGEEGKEGDEGEEVEGVEGEGEDEEEEESEDGEEADVVEEPKIETEFDKELLAFFKEVDEDGSGTISKEEFGNFMRKLGYRFTMVELQEMIDEIDKDRSGQIGFDEFKLIMTKTIKDEFNINSSIEAFALFDKNKNEKINKSVLMNILLTRSDHQHSEAELNDLLKYVNFDEHEEVNYRELILETFNFFNY